MKNPIYLTEEGRKELEEIIKELREESSKIDRVFELSYAISMEATIEVYKEILSNSIILPKDYIPNPEHEKYTGHKTWAENKAYDKGKEDEETIVFEFIQK